MLKTYFHNAKHSSKNKSQKKTIPTQYVDQKRIVDINKLLNTVRIEKKLKLKEKSFFTVQQF